MNDPSQQELRTENAVASHGDGVPIGPPSFADRAASISCCASLAVYALGAASTLSRLLWGLLLIIDLAAFGLGIYGIIGGVNRRATATIRMGTYGVLLSGIPLALWLVRVIGRICG